MVQQLLHWSSIAKVLSSNFDRNILQKKKETQKPVQHSSPVFAVLTGSLAKSTKAQNRTGVMAGSRVQPVESASPVPIFKTLILLEVLELCKAQLGPPRNLVQHITSNYFNMMNEQKYRRKLSIKTIKIDKCYLNSHFY